jgi:mono/diheme cytochrome c family protein
VRAAGLVRIVALAGLLPAAYFTGAAAADPSAPTFSKDVAPILFKNCATCHGAGGIASALPLLSYDAAKSRAGTIREKVLTRQMPPWPADSEHSLKFRNDARLSRRDIDTLIAWVDSGTARGSDADLPAMPTYPQGWLHPKGLAPDAVVALPEFSVRATGEVPYIQRLIKVPYAQDKWIIAMQVRPGNPALLHHMGITEITLPVAIRPEDLQAFAAVASQLGIPNGALDTARAAVTDPANPEAYDMLGVYTPGTSFESYPEGSARLLKGGGNSYINFNIHYTTTGRPETDRSQLALWFRSTPPQHQLFREPAAVKTLLANGRELLTDDAGTKAEGTEVAIPPIPAYAENYELIGMTAYTEPVTIYQFQPHAHVRAKDFRYTVVYPDGREETVLSVPKYDFHWQLAYDLERPLHLPAGSKLMVTAHYDNSAKNEHLRDLGDSESARNCGPDKVAYFRRQNQSWDEMFSPFVQYSIDNSDPTQSAGKSPKAAEIVEVVGCLAQSRPAMWMLTHGSDPVASPAQSTSSVEVLATAARALGNRQYQLLGAEVFNPQSNVGRKAVVKGVLIRDAKGARLNVTSLQMSAADCQESDAH